MGPRAALLGGAVRVLFCNVTRKKEGFLDFAEGSPKPLVEELVALPHPVPTRCRSEAVLSSSGFSKVETPVSLECVYT